MEDVWLPVPVLRHGNILMNQMALYFLLPVMALVLTLIVTYSRHLLFI